jgi:hypothetical protein
MANGRKTGGRQKGTPNRATADIKNLARVHGPAVIAELARMSGVTDAPGAQTLAARIAAMRELLDRAFGRRSCAPSQPVSHARWQAVRQCGRPPAEWIWP